MDLKLAIFSAIVAFLAAMVAQWISHRLTIKRENQKYNNEVIQEYILPRLNDVMLYIDTETHFRKGHDVEVEVKPEEIIKNIEYKVKYANTYS